MSGDALVYGHIFMFFLILSRYIGMMLLTPIFNSRVIFYQAKIYLALSLAIITFPLVNNLYQPIYPASNLQVVISLISEASIGLFMGLTVFIVFAAIQLGGQIIDMRMGFRIANVVDPFSGADSPVIGQLKNIFITLLFLSLNGHLYLIRHLYDSFKIIPPAQAAFSNQIWEYFFRRSADMFALAIQVALPIAGAVFLIDIILAFLARSVPQMNLFVIGLPVKIMAGLILLFVLLPILNNFYSQVIRDIISEVPKMFRLLAP